MVVDLPQGLQCHARACHHFSRLVESRDDSLGQLVVANCRWPQNPVGMITDWYGWRGRWLSRRAQTPRPRDGIQEPFGSECEGLIKGRVLGFSNVQSELIKIFEALRESALFASWLVFEPYRMKKWRLRGPRRASARHSIRADFHHLSTMRSRSGGRNLSVQTSSTFGIFGSLYASTTAAMFCCTRFGSTVLSPFIFV
jgi:hypothetical protein